MKTFFAISCLVLLFCAKTLVDASIPHDNGLWLDLSSNATFIKNAKNETEVGNGSTTFLLTVQLFTPPHHFFIGLYYTVEFYYHNGTNKTDHILATHRVIAIPNSGKQHHIFIVPADLPAGISVHSGEHFAFPTFEVVVNPEKNNLVHFSHFWVVLNDEYARNMKYRSNILPSPPALNYTFTKVNSTSELTYDAKCSLGHFDPEGKSFSVKFMYSKTTNQEHHLLATYRVHGGNPDSLEEFIPESSNETVAMGKSLFFPNYEITVKKFNATLPSYCTLVVDGSAMGEIKSNEISLK